MTGPTTSSVLSAPSPRRRRADALKLLARDKAASIALGFLVLLILFAVFGPALVPGSATHVDITNRFLPPVWNGGVPKDPFGTDSLGRDILARLAAGARISLSIGLIVVLISGVVGTLLGIIAGYKGGKVETVIMRFADAQLAFPGLLLVLLVVAFFRPTIPLIIGLVAFYGWMIYARLVRSVVLQVKQSPSVQAAQLLGASTPRILFFHVLPSVYSLILTQGMLELSRVMLVEASLSYLGYGVQPPDVSWGLMVAENQADFVHAWWTVVFPGLSLAVTVVAINLVANWLRTLTDPRQRELRLAPRRREVNTASLDPDDAPAPSTSGRTPLLEVRNMDAVFETPSGPVPAVRGMTLSIAPGETVGIVGESGSGKSSTALALLGLIPPPGHVSGTFRWQGRDVTHAQLTALRGSGITMIFQDPMTSLNPLVPVGRQVAEVLRFHKKMSWKDAHRRALELFELVGIPSAKERLRQYPFQLSGGLRQRVMIACALAPDPQLIVADEPTTALDVTVQAQILEVIAEIRGRLNVAMLLITHDLGVVAGECDRVMVMYGGRLVEEAPTDSLFASPRHRYTQALLAASPRIDAVQNGHLATIPGQPPTRISAGPGCPFAARCAFASSECAVMPAMTWVGQGERFACWHPAEEMSR